MGISRGAPALEIEAHHFLSDGTSMIVSIATFDAERFQFRPDFEII